MGSNPLSAASRSSQLKQQLRHERRKIERHKIDADVSPAFGEKKRHMWTTAFVSCRQLVSDISMPFLMSIFVAAVIVVVVTTFRDPRRSSLIDVDDSIASDCGDSPDVDDAESVTSPVRVSLVSRWGEFGGDRFLLSLESDPWWVDNWNIGEKYQNVFIQMINK